MELSKEAIQKRVLQNGKQLSLDKFLWDGNTRTFSSLEDDLVLDFSNLNNCIFSTGSYCTFSTGSDCTFSTGSDCIFSTGYNCNFKTDSSCTFDTGSSCTFDTGSRCIVVRRGIFEVILLKENIKTILCPYNIKGYLEEHNSKWYLNGNIEDGEYIIVDNILSKVIKRKGSILKVINHSDTEESYIVEQDDIFSHGKTLKEARDSLVYKMSSRDLTEFKSLTLESVLTKEEAIRMYMSVTGACAFGTRQFIESRDIKEVYTIKEIIELTQYQYGNQRLKEFFSLI